MGDAISICNPLSTDAQIHDGIIMLLKEIAIILVVGRANIPHSSERINPVENEGEHSETVYHGLKRVSSSPVLFLIYISKTVVYCLYSPIILVL